MTVKKTSGSSTPSVPSGIRTSSPGGKYLLIPVSEGSAIYSPFPGKIINPSKYSIPPESSEGHAVWIQVDSGVILCISRMKYSTNLVFGQKVEAGTFIGKAGGSTTEGNGMILRRHESAAVRMDMFITKGSRLERIMPGKMS